MQLLIGDVAGIQTGIATGVAGSINASFVYPCKTAYAVSGIIYANTPEVRGLKVSAVGTVACDLQAVGNVITLIGTVAQFTWLGAVFSNVSVNFVYRRMADPENNRTKTAADITLAGRFGIWNGVDWYNVSMSLTPTVPFSSNGTKGDVTLKSASMGLAFGTNVAVLSTNVSTNGSPVGWAMSLNMTYSATPVCVATQIAGLANGSLPLTGLLAINLPSYGLAMRVALNGSMACNTSAVGAAYQLKGIVLSLAYNAWTVSNVGVTFERGNVLDAKTDSIAPYTSISLGGNITRGGNMFGILIALKWTGPDSNLTVTVTLFSSFAVALPADGWLYGNATLSAPYPCTSAGYTGGVQLAFAGSAFGMSGIAGAANFSVRCDLRAFGIKMAVGTGGLPSFTLGTEKFSLKSPTITLAYDYNKTVAGGGDGTATYLDLSISTNFTNNGIVTIKGSLPVKPDGSSISISGSFAEITPIRAITYLLDCLPPRPTSISMPPLPALDQTDFMKQCVQLARAAIFSALTHSSRAG